MRELAPLWWVLRGVVAVGLVEILFSRSIFSGPDSYAILVALAMALTASVSVAIGLRRPRRTAALVVVNVVLALATVPVISDTIEPWTQRRDQQRRRDRHRDGSRTGAGSYNGAPVQNIYAFDRQGRLLQDVRLFDQDGQPLEIGADPTDPSRRTVADPGRNARLQRVPDPLLRARARGASPTPPPERPSTPARWPPSRSARPSDHGAMSFAPSGGS